MKEEQKSFIRSELKWASIVIAFTASVLFNYFTVIKCVQLNTYRIEEIEGDREEKWEKYDECIADRNLLLKAIGEDIAIIKTKLEVIEKGLK